jgi:hypothetical protein
MDGLLKDTHKPVKWIGSTTEPSKDERRNSTRTSVENIFKPENGKHKLLFGSDTIPLEIDVAALINEIKDISEKGGISLTHGEKL